ncbi:tetratricopeptide repeat-containing sulfotransferase family protein [Tsuneonella sp. HG094]
MRDLATVMAQATGAFHGGDFTRARDLAQRAAHSEPTNVQVLQFLGIAQAQSGDPQSGLATLKRAIGLAPSDKQLRLNAARAAIDAGAFDEVESICLPLGSEPAAQQVLAQAARLSGDARTASDRLGALVAKNPADSRLLNNYGNALIDAGHVKEAIAAFEKASALDPNNPQVWLNLGRAHSIDQRFNQALAAFRTAIALPSADAEVTLELGKSLLRYGCYEEALPQLSEAARRGKRDAQVIVMIGLCYSGMEKLADAERAYRTALSIDPTSPDAILNLALQLERENREDEIERLAKAARKAGMDGAALWYCDALVLRRKGDNRAALDIIEAHHPEGMDVYAREQLIGQLADRVGDADRAFAAFSAMNGEMLLTPSGQQHSGTEYIRSIAEDTGTLTPQWYSHWTGEAPRDGRASPAFLGGFLRSGTTLLDTVLMGHADTEVREEQAMITRLREIAGSLEALPTLPAERIALMRAAYFSELRAGGPVPAGKLIVDKFPLMTLRAAYVHRAFPDAKFIFALRHPCDVVLSCWMQNFRITSAMSSFLTLENAARFYDAAMTHWERAREVLPLDVHTVRYEDMVVDLEGELRPLIAFLGLEWDDALLNHQKTARDRGYIRTPSYAQVTEKIYTRSSGRWESYRAHMEPILPILAPWVEKFGYEPV